MFNFSSSSFPSSVTSLCLSDSAPIVYYSTYICFQILCDCRLLQILLELLLIGSSKQQSGIKTQSRTILFNVFITQVIKRWVGMYSQFFWSLFLKNRSRLHGRRMSEIHSWKDWKVFKRFRLKNFQNFNSGTFKRNWLKTFHIKKHVWRGGRLKIQKNAHESKTKTIFQVRDIDIFLTLPHSNHRKIKIKRM